MVGPHLDVVVLLEVSALAPHLAGLGVDGDGLDGTGQSRPEAIVSAKLTHF